MNLCQNLITDLFWTSDPYGFNAGSELTATPVSDPVAATIQASHQNVLLWERSALKGWQPKFSDRDVFDACRAMSRGGHFASALGTALTYADSTNRDLILKTWPHLILKYLRFARLTERETQ